MTEQEYQAKLDAISAEIEEARQMIIKACQMRNGPNTEAGYKWWQAARRKLTKAIKTHEGLR